MVEVDPLVLGGLIVGIITLLTIVLGVTFRHGKNHGRIDNQIKNIENALESNKDPLAFANALWHMTKNQGLIDLVKSIGPEPPKRNPYDLNRKFELLTRYQNGSINLAEAQELQTILQEDAKHAEETNSAALVGIIILLAALVVIIGILGSSKK